MLSTGQLGNVGIKQRTLVSAANTIIEQPGRRSRILSEALRLGPRPVLFSL
jgi:hypothetical protein